MSYLKDTKDIFQSIEQAKSITQLNSVLINSKFNTFKFDETQYPRLNFSIPKSEIDSLKNNGILDSDFNISMIAEGTDSLTKLLYALAWKNGDLKKIKHIIQGISDSEGENTKKDALVFYQFGKHLNNKKEPIIDQHVLRAYGIWEKLKANNYNEVNSEIDRLKKLSSITKKEKDLIERYKNWLRADLNEDLRKEKDYAYHVDKVLFAIGKSLKIKTEKKSLKK